MSSSGATASAPATPLPPFTAESTPLVSSYPDAKGVATTGDRPLYGGLLVGLAYCIFPCMALCVDRISSTALPFVLLMHGP